jgi:hypothetical protein
MEYPRRLGELRQKIQALRERELGGAGPNPCLNWSSMDKEDYARLCGAMDSLHDMESALVGLWGKIERGEKPTELECLGFLQAIYIEQDCVREIYRALKRTDFALTAELKLIRDMRNRVSGHAAFAEQVKPPGSAMWKPASISSSGFEMVIYFVCGSRTEFLDFRNFIRTKNDGLADLLQVVLDQLNQPDP